MPVSRDKLRKNIQERFTVSYYINRKDFTPMIILPIIAIGLVYGIGWLINKPIDSTESSSELYTKINDVMSRIEVGMNKDDYNKQMQELNVKINNFKLDSNSVKGHNGANLLSVSQWLLDANDSMELMPEMDDPYHKIWNPQSKWINARHSYKILEACKLKGEGCFTLKHQLNFSYILSKNYSPKSIKL
jgi:hypothetical protein